LSKEDESNDHQHPGRWVMNTTDVLFDITGYNVSDWILQTHNDFIDARFGGWSIANQDHEEIENASYPSWINGTRRKLIVWYNNKAYHALPSYTSAVHNAMLRAVVEPPERRAAYGISTFSHPLKLTIGQIDAQSM
jgi:hypothetical protein